MATAETEVKRKTYPPHSIRFIHRHYNGTENPLDIQLEKASELLKIDISELWENYLASGTAQNRGRIPGNDPRIPYTLRWVLRSLEPKNNESELRSDYETWKMIQELIRRMPIVELAKVIKHGGLIKQIEKTLENMRDRTVEVLNEPAKKWEGQDYSADQSPLASPPLANEDYKELKKRGREGKVEIAIPSRGFLYPDIRAVFTSICGVVHELVGIVNGNEQGPRGNEKQILKHAIKSTPESLANILGCAFYVTNSLLQPSKTKEVDEHPGHLESVAFEPCLTPLIQLWQFSVSTLQYSAPAQVHAAFFDSSLVPALQMLHACSQKDSEYDNFSKVSESIQGLLTTYVILPHRQTFLEQSAAAYDDNLGSGTFSHDLVGRLLARRMVKRLDNPKAGDKLLEHLLSAHMSLLFSVGVESRPRHTHKLRQAEDPWLEYLLLDLIKADDILLSRDRRPQNNPRHQKRLIRFTLETCHNTSIRLSINTLRKVLDKAAGLGEDSDAPKIEWDLVGYCLAIDADAFLLSGSGEDESAECPTQPHKYLKNLLKGLTYTLPEKSADWEDVLKYTVIPLLDGFVNARRLPDFFTYWAQQLQHLHERREISQDSKELLKPLKKDSLWERESLRQAASAHVESLRIEQITAIAAMAINKLRASNSASNTAAFVILDCIYLGIVSDEKIDKLAPSARESFQLLIDILMQDKISEQIYRWRIWRILTAITQRWSTRLGYTFHVDSITSASDKALALLKEIAQWEAPAPQGKNSSHHAKNYDEPYQAFVYILSFAGVENRLLLDEKRLQRNAQRAVSTILDVLEPLCSRVEKDYYSNFDYKQTESRCFAPGSPTRSVDALYLGCASHLMSNPFALCVLKEDDIRRIVRQAFYLALCQRTRPASVPLNVVDFEWPWYQLTRHLTTLDSPATERAVARRLHSECERHCDFEDGRVFKQDGPDYLLSLEALQNIDLSIFTDKERVNLANRVLKILVKVRFARANRLLHHLDLLIRLAGKPARNMHLLNNGKYLDRENIHHTMKFIEGTSLILRIAQNIAHEELAFDLDLALIERVCRIARYTINYLFETLDYNESRDHLRNAQDQVHDWLASDKIASEPARVMFTNVTGEILRIMNAQPTTNLEKAGIEPSVLRSLRQLHLDRLLRHLKFRIRYHLDGNWETSLGEPLKRFELGLVMEQMDHHVDLLNIHPELIMPITLPQWPMGGCYETLKFIFRQLAEHGINYTWNMRDYHTYGVEYMLVQLASLCLALCHGHQGLIYWILEAQKIKKLLLGAKADPAPCEPSIQDLQAKLDRNIRAAIKTLDWRLRAKLLQSASEEDLSNSDIVSLTKTIVLAKRTELTAGAKLALSRKFQQLCETPDPIYDLHATIDSLRVLATLLTDYRPVITQNHIELTLLTIVRTSHRLASSNSEEPEIPASDAPYIFTCLTRLFTILLHSHRSRLRGRHHLTIAALNALLPLFFTPYPTADDPGPDSTTPSTPTPAHASAYARLLTLFCDPSPSAVTTKKRKFSEREHLSDETKKAKAMVGKYIPGWIECYCGLLLRGRMEEGIRKELMGGVWAALEVVKKERLEGMSDAMGKEEREVFRGIWQEFKG